MVCNVNMFNREESVSVNKLNLSQSNSDMSQIICRNQLFFYNFGNKSNIIPKLNN